MALNKVQLIGNLGRDPEIRTFANGDKVANLRIATTDKWKDKATGERREATEWHSVSIFGGLVSVVERYTTKGSKLYVEGKLRTRKWSDQSGQERYATEIVVQGFGGTIELLGDAGGRSGGGHASGQGSGQSSGPSPSNFAGQSAPPSEDLDDEIPF